MQKSLLVTFAGLITLAAPCAMAEVGMGIRGGTFGYGLDFDVGVTDHLALRVGYNYLDYNQTVTDTDVRYDGKLKISSVSGFLDWHPFAGGFRLSLGAVGSGPKVDVVGTPTASGTFELNGNTYTTAQIGSLTGQIKVGNSVAPYVGIGYGNVPRGRHPVTFLFDLGAIYGGTPKVSLTATCSSSLTAQQCAALQSQLDTDVAAEIARLENNVNEIKWYPIVSIGLGIRF